MANIGESVVFKGDLSGEEDLVIEGHIEGVIQLPNHQLTIGEQGRVKAEISAKVITVAGRVAGSVVASERCEVHATAIVDGDIRAPRLTIQEGAVVNGKIEMGQQSKAQRTDEATSSEQGGAPGPARRTG